MRTMLILITCAGTLLLHGCSNDTSQSGSEPPVSNGGTGTPAALPKGEGHAAASVVPGSYEDWCAEHEVAETQCTRCDPSLIPAFQAAGDWDPDHGLPMSQCTIHDPNLEITRPPKPEGK